jgi:chromosome segregation ATPase
MKYLSKLLSMLLVGAMLYSTGCTDYGADIDKLNEKVDELYETLQDGQIDPLKADLAQTKEDLAKAEAAIAALTTKHNEDIAALKAVDTQLDGKITAANDAILALEAALEQEVKDLEDQIAALNTAIEQAKQEAANANDALKQELLQEITDLETELVAAVSELQSKLEGDIKDLRDDMQKKIDDANAAIDEANDDIDKLELRADGLEKTDDELKAAIEELEKAISENKAKLTVLEGDLAKEKTAREEADALEAKARQEADAALKAELLNEIAIEKAAREAAIAALEEAIEALEAKLDAQVALLQDAIKALENKVDNELNILKHRDAEFEQLLAAAQAGIESLGKEIDAKYNELKADAASLKAELQTEINANKTAIAQNRADIDRAFATLSTLEGNLAALQSSMQTINQTLFALSSDYYNFKAEITGRVAALEASVANLESLYAQIVEDLIPALEQQIAVNEGLLEETIGNVATNAAELAEFKKAAAATYSLLEQADAALWQAIATLNQTVYENRSDIAALRTELLESLTNVRAEYAASFAAIDSELKNLATVQANQYNVLVASIEAVRELTANNAAAIAEEIKERQAADAAISKELADFKAAYDVKVAELEQAIAALESRVSALEKDLAAYKTEVANAIEKAVTRAIEEAYKKAEGYTDMKINSVMEYIDIELGKINNKIADVQKSINDVIDAYTEADRILAEEIIKGDDLLKEQINEIVRRAQSLVFVPKYVDGKGTINFAKAGETVVESRSQAEYQVYPAECANAIVSAFDPEKPILSFDNKYLTTRSGLLSFDVVAVEAGSQEGRILVTFEPRGLDAEFYASTTKEYALSLVLNDGTANISSPYTNFVRAKKAENIRMAIMFEGKAVSDNYTVYEFEYTDVENPRSVLENHYVKFTVGNKSYNGIAELNAAGYDVNLTSSIYTYRKWNTHLGLRPFAVEEDANGVLKVWVNEIKREYVYQPLEVGYEYVLGTLNAKAYATVYTVPVQATVAYEAIDINWTYADDIAVDAARYAAQNAVYSRNNLILGAQENNLPDDITLVTALTSTLTKPATVTLDGEEVAVDAEFVLDEENNVKINLSGFEWDKTYEVTAVYSVKDKNNQDSAIVTVKVPVNTHDRSRDIIEVKLAEEDWMLTRNFQYQSETAAESLETIYEQAKSYLPETTTAEEFLKNILVDNAFDFENKANGEAEEFTQLVIENDGTEVKSVYNVNDFAKIPEAVEYVYNITTWYGQEIVITKKLNTGLAPVEITLPTVTKAIAKNLEFFTDADSLAEIFTNVTRVKEGEFTATEYLAAIFTDNKFRPKRAQKDLANGVELANTKLVVDPKTGAIIKAAYSYTDFTEVAPLTVNYQTTYTTWYGQEITINKVVNFAFPAYDFKHNPHYVYGADNDFYSQVLPEYTWNNNNEADGLLMFDVAKVDLRSAFSVVEGENKLTAEKMAELGLVFNFVIEDKEHYGIAIDPATDQLSYYGGNPFVNVCGNLYIVNNNGTRYTVPTSFDEGGNYASYRVLKFNPIATAELDQSKSTTIKVDNAIKYHVHVLDYIKLYDYRVGGRQSYPLIQDGAWVIGNGVNGFADGVDVRADYIYRISEVWSNDTSHLDADIRPFITLNNGTLTFDNTQQLELTAPFKVPVTLEFQNCWMEKPDKVTVVFTFNPIK